MCYYRHVAAQFNYIFPFIETEKEMLIGTIHLLMHFEQSRILEYILLSASVEKSLEANGYSPLLYHPKFDCLIQKSPTPFSVFNQINPTQILTSYFMMHHHHHHHHWHNSPFRASSAASASCPYSLQHSSNFSPPTSWHLPSHHLPISVSACPSVFFLLPLQRELFL